MSVFKMKELKIGNLTAKLPIIQGGMGIGVSMSSLASAVANLGGIGVLSAAGVGMFEHDFHTNYLEANIRALRNEIRKAREKTKGIIGLNIMVAMANFSDMVETALDEGIDIIFSGAGLPLHLPKYLGKLLKTKLIPIVSSGRAAGIIAKRWSEKYDYVPDAFVVEGPQAGGHLGFKIEQIDDPNYSLEKILTDVLHKIDPFEKVSKKSIPVIAAGGIYTGKDIYDIMRQGASGVQMATRFVTTHECDASLEFKNAYISATQEGIGIIKSPVGMPGRAITNDFIKDISAGEKKPFKCPYHCIITCDYLKSPYCIALALMNAKKGNMQNGFAFAGKNAYKATEIISVEELIDTLESEFIDAHFTDDFIKSSVNSLMLETNIY